MMAQSFAIRKGSWTEEEDILLRQCVDKYGEGNWRRVPLIAGLRRCHKSCRLRWLNYLRPNIKRGKFGEDEVDLLLRLHKLLGNKWSLIAGRLPGRTDNDVKNYWNSHFNRKIITSGGITASKREEVKATIRPVRKKDQVIRPRPWSFPKTSPWVQLRSSSSTNVGGNNCNDSREMLGMTCPILPSTTAQGSTRLDQQERNSSDKELEKSKSKSDYTSRFADDLIRSLLVEDDMQPMSQFGNHNSLEEGSIYWDEDFCLDFNIWGMPVEW